MTPNIQIAPVNDSSPWHPLSKCPISMTLNMMTRTFTDYYMIEVMAISTWRMSCMLTIWPCGHVSPEHHHTPGSGLESHCYPWDLWARHQCWSRSHSTWDRICQAPYHWSLWSQQQWYQSVVRWRQVVTRYHEREERDEWVRMQWYVVYWVVCRVRHSRYLVSLVSMVL